jgi:hypothetical protein
VVPEKQSVKSNWVESYARFVIRKLPGARVAYNSLLCVGVVGLNDEDNCLMQTLFEGTTVI